jgi:electron transfer DM13
MKGRVWLLRVLPAIAFVATFGVFFVDKNREARTVFKSGRGLLTMIAIVGGYLLLGLVLRRVVRWTWLAPLVLTGLTLSLAAWIVRPYYVDETANRRLVAGAVRDVSPSPAPAPDQGTQPALPTPAGPVRISTGTIQGIGHDARGSISIIRNADASLVVRFQDFDIEGTPDPRVHLVEGRDAHDPDGRELGRLSGNRGQVLDYAVPSGTNAGPGWTVLVWCRSFAVPIANATQGAA